MQKKSSIMLLALFSLSIFLAACSPATSLSQPTTAAPASPAVSATAPATATPTPPNPASGLLSPREALAQMFGKEGVPSADGTQVTVTEKNGYSHPIEINTLDCYWELNLEKCLVITDWSKAQCQFCDVYFEGALFERAGRGWVMRTFNPSIDLPSSFGYASKGALIRIGDQKHALVFRSGYGNLGYFHETVTLVAESGGSIGIILQYFSSQSDPLGAKYVSEMDLYPDPKNKDYYQIEVSYFGADSTGDTPRTRIYVFSGTQYVLPGPTPTFVPIPTLTPQPTYTPGPPPTTTPTIQPVVELPPLKIIVADQVTTIDNFSSTISSIRWSDDGKRLIMGPQINQLYFFDVLNKSITISPLKISASSSGGPISPTKTLAEIRCNSGGEEGAVFAPCPITNYSIFFIDLETGKVIRTVPLPSVNDPARPRGRLLISPDGKYLIGSGGTEISLWDSATGRKIKDISNYGSETSVGWMSLSPDGRFLVAQSYLRDSPKQTFTVWSTSTWQLQRTFSGKHPGPQGFGFSFSPDGTRLVSSGGDGLYDLSVWDFQTGKTLYSLTAHPGISTSAFDPTGRYFAVGGTGYDVANWEFVQIYDARTGRLVRRLASPYLVISALAFSPDGTKLAAGGGSDRPGEVKIWDLTQP